MPKIATYPKIQKKIEPDWEVIKPRKKGSVTKTPRLKIAITEFASGRIRWESCDFRF